MISDMAAKQSGLNGDPIDYAVWGSYKSVCTTTIESRTCKSCAKQEWDGLDQEVIDNAISEWRKRLTACVTAGKGHFKHSL